jgi:hypothetical protein
MRLLHRPHLPPRRAWLFLIAILVPCVALLALGAWMLIQERQLDGRRRTEEQQRRVDHVRQELLSLLETAKLHEVTRVAARGGSAELFKPDQVVVLVGSLLDGTLRLPWENQPEAQKFRTWLADGNFAEAMRKAEAQEFLARHARNAADQYRAARDAAAEPAQRTYASLLLAPTLQKLDRRA